MFGSIGNAFGDAVDWVGDRAEDAGEVISDGVDAIAGGISDGVDAVGSGASAGWNAAEDAVVEIGNFATSAFSTIGSGIGSGAGLVGRFLESAPTDIWNGANKFVDLGVYELTSGARRIADIGVDLGETLWQRGSNSFTVVTDGFSTLADEGFNTIRGIGGGLGNAGSALGNGFVNVFNDGVSTVGKAGGALLEGDVLEAGEHLVDGVGNAAEHVAEAAAGAAEGVVEAGSAAAEGALDMAGTAAGMAGEVGKDYMQAAGKIVTSGVEVVGAIAEAEVKILYGGAEIAADTVGGPLGEFYGNVIHNYGEAVTSTLDHMRETINGGVDAGTSWGGEYVNMLGENADTLGHDAGQVVDDISRGDFDAAAEHLGELLEDGVDALKDFGESQVDGVKALAEIASGIKTVLNGLNEAMAKAGGGFVSAVGETLGGDVGEALEDAGDWFGEKTELASDLVQGDLEGAAKEGAKELGGLGGEWLGDRLQDGTNWLGNELGGIPGDAIKAGGDAAADGIKSAMRDLAGSAAGKGLDAVNGNASPPPGGTAGSAASSAAPHKDESLMERGQHAVDNAAHGLIDKVDNAIQNTMHDPQWLLTQIADGIKDHADDKGFAGALGKLLGMTDGNHANGDAAAHAAEAAPTGTAHAALTMEPAAESSVSSFWDQAGQGDGHGLDSPTVVQALTQGTAASAVANADIPVLQAQPIVPSFGDPESTESTFAGHATLAALNPQPLPPDPGEAIVLGHELKALLQNILHDASFDAMETLEGMMQHSQPQQQEPHLDTTLMAQFESLRMPESEFAHQLF
ncbi:hypothetical protein [Bradyrhizobium sp. JYMT SZCCT0180]|uniref:hypothetical protein n=1 Tax=Bradyrhizobium sp. JYMT SZCCT0180 TaxID=2807666 RepID=UPI001BAE0D4F|nr:hypothetical protein [Bradyrhizobium sp. JYMT SZCCT0180]MBR1209640.1 hypothetical protein [Bradyrhizobium sp. JYMT SZCCT0180]